MATILLAMADLREQGAVLKSLESLDHEVTSAANGMEALGHIYADEFDLVLLDSVSPQIGGLGLLDVIRSRSPQTMVVVLSNSSDVNNAVEALRKGAFDSLRIPVEQGELRAIIADSLEEARIMKRVGYIYKDKRRQDRTLLMGGVKFAISDSLIAGLAFYLVFALRDILPGILKLQMFIGRSELLLMSLGLAFCYSFVFVLKRGHRVDLIKSRSEAAWQLWRNISYAYVLHLAILFLVKDMNFAASRTAIGLSYILGYLGLLASRFLVLPGLASKFSREGKKSIVILSKGKPAMRASQQLKRHSNARQVANYIDKESKVANEPKRNARVIATPQDADRLVPSDDIEELHIAGDAFSMAEILSLMDRFRGRKVKIIIFNSLNEIPIQKDTALVSAQSV